MTEIGEIFKPLKNIFLVLLILFTLLLFNVSNKYYHDAFAVCLNDKPLYVYYYEQYRRGLIPFLFGAEGGQQSSSNDIIPVVNELKYDDNITLKITEYSVYWADSKDRSYSNRAWSLIDKYTYKKEKLGASKLVIKRKSKTIYDGAYIENISKYVNEPGRYYFQATIYRKDNFYTTVKTHMSFNVIVVGD